MSDNSNPSDNNNNNNNNNNDSNKYIKTFNLQSNCVHIKVDIIKVIENSTSLNSGTINPYGDIAADVITSDIFGTIKTSVILERCMMFFSDKASFSISPDKLSFTVIYKDKKNVELKTKVTWIKIGWSIMQNNNLNIRKFISITNPLVINEVMSLILVNLKKENAKRIRDLLLYKIKFLNFSSIKEIKMNKLDPYDISIIMLQERPSFIGEYEVITKLIQNLFNENNFTEVNIITSCPNHKIDQ
jgi:hypothetical protein